MPRPTKSVQKYIRELPDGRHIEFPDHLCSHINNQGRFCSQPSEIDPLTKLKIGKCMKHIEAGISTTQQRKMMRTAGSVPPTPMTPASISGADPEIYLTLNHLVDRHRTTDVILKNLNDRISKIDTIQTQITSTMDKLDTLDTNFILLKKFIQEFAEKKKRKLIFDSDSDTDEHDNDQADKRQRIV